MSDDSGLNFRSVNARRIASIDAFRGLTILVMIFVNDLASVEQAPWWMKHFPADRDGMTFVDIVFPAFLFIVGMVIPVALHRRRERLGSWVKVSGHVLTRTVSLLIIGVFMVNMHVEGKGVHLSLPMWSLLAFAGVMLVWRAIPPEPGRARIISVALRMTGVVALVFLAYLYRMLDGEQVFAMRTMWWGILGLIGWAYLVSCFVYCVTRGSVTAMMCSLWILLCIFIGDRAGLFSHWAYVKQKVDIGTMIGSHSSIVVAGLILGVVVMRPSGRTHVYRLRWAFVFGIGMAIGAVLLRPVYGISKVKATPSWCLWGIAYSCWIWAALYWFMDVRGWKGWAVFVRPAGENPLMAYILAPMFYAFFDVTGFDLYHRLDSSSFPAGLARSILFALFIVWLTGLLKRKGFRLRL